MPRVPYQTTPFTIDPSARSTQTFAERYGVSPPHSNENLYGNDYTIVGTRSDDKCPVRNEMQTRNHKVELSKAPSSSNITQETTNNNNNGSNEGENSSKAFKSTVIKGSKNAPNNTHSTSFDVEQRFQVSLSFSHYLYCKLFFNYIASRSSHFQSETIFQLIHAYRKIYSWTQKAFVETKKLSILSYHSKEKGLHISCNFLSTSHVDKLFDWKKWQMQKHFAKKTELPLLIGCSLNESVTR
jgi:hypothetical protein